MMYPLVGDLAGEGIPVRVSCRVLGFSTTAYHAWCRNPVSQRDWDDAHLINAAFDVHADDPEFGYRLIADELIYAMGFQVGENRVQRLCSLAGITSVIVKKRGSGKKAGPAVHDDHVNRDFTADAVNVKWLVDITEHWTLEGKVYLCAIKDCASTRIVGYAIDSRMTSELAVSALRMAIILRGRPAGTIVHSDRGGQGGFNWSSQHPQVSEVGSDGDGGLAQEDQRCARGRAPTVACRSGVTPAYALAGAA